MTTPEERKQREIALRKVRWALYYKKLYKPRACERCGTQQERLQAYHADYSKPLEVTWLCWTGRRPCYSTDLVS